MPSHDTPKNAEKIAVIVLAGGRGKRMKSDLPKVLTSTREKPLIVHVLETASALNPEKLVVVTGYKRELVHEVINSTPVAASKGFSFAEQKEQLGTGDAVKSALPALKGFTGTVLILYGDAPLVRSSTLQSLLALHLNEKATVTLLSFIPTDPKSYGRVVRDRTSGRLSKIVEAKDCSASELAIRECNSGIYAVDSAFLSPAVESITNNNAQKEYYLTDIIEKASKEGQNISTLVGSDATETEGVNTPFELSAVNEILLRRQREELLNSGVILEDPSSCFIDKAATIRPGAVIGPNVQIKGKSVIEEGVVIDGTAFLINTTARKGAHIKFGVRAEDAIIGEKAQIGPFAHLRPGTVLASDVHIGNFVETKKANLAQGVKANHLTYLGDCSIGEKTNVGAGTITCNYDGFDKHFTTIGKEVFVGSDVCLIAPVTIEDGSTIGAGSVITKKVEKDSLALTRAPQVIKAGWAKAMRDRKRKAPKA